MEKVDVNDIVLDGDQFESKIAHLKEHNAICIFKALWL